jgi:hypothetical protein
VWIHDRHKGILLAINDIKEGSEERNRAAQWPNVHSRWCMRHMRANFHSQFKNQKLTKLFKRLCLTNQEKKFYDLWQKLDSALYIPNPDPTMCQGVGRRKKKRIRNNMDEAEVGPQVQICSKCNNPRHSYKKCTEASYFSTATSTPPSASALGRHSSRYNEGMQ